MAEMTMQSGHHTLRRLLLTGALLFTITGITAQDDIYGDTDTYNPLGGYSTHDQHIESGNTYTNYYGDEAYDYFWALRIWRFHRPAFGFGYYDLFYTNLYWYNRDPWAYGISPYANWGWGGTYNPWWHPGGYPMWGWNSWGYQPYPYGGWGYGQGYWNGYPNTYTQNRGSYWGHRGGSNQSAGNPRMSAPASGAQPTPARRVDDGERMNDYTPVSKPSPEPQQIRTRPVIAPVQRPVQYSPRAVPGSEAPPRRPQRPQPSRYTPQQTPPQQITPRQSPPRQTPRKVAPHRTFQSPQKGAIAS